MGLDISYYSKLTRVACPADADEGYCDHVNIWPNEGDYAGREAPLEKGCYTGEEIGDFRAGSYSGYNTWREALARVALGVEPRIVWEDPEGFAGRPFVELIDFSDCEGTIGPVVAAKLAKDFADYDDRARDGLDDYHYGKYVAWRKAFEAAQDGGAVRFH